MDFSAQQTALSNCPDCGTPVKEHYKPDCDVERCTACGQQKFTCDCESGHTVWTGVWTQAELTGEQIARQDFADGCIQSLLEQLAGNVLKEEVELLGEIRDVISDAFDRRGIMTEIDLYRFIES